MKMKVENEEVKVQKQRLLINTCKVIEYLEPIMSKELLFKFPDNSAFDFDHSQSSIWSPLIPRVQNPVVDLDLDLFTPKKLSFSNKKKRIRVSKNMVTSTVQKKLKMKKKSEVKGSGFSPTPVKGSCALFATKGWNKLLKAASKHFKKKKKEPTCCHVKLSNYLMD